MRNESTGILKIISIIQTLISYCSFENIFVAIDEMDAGIFEYLFGKLLAVLKSLGKGQLFFSSHNLRPLEVLDYKNVLLILKSQPLAQLKSVFYLIVCHIFETYLQKE